MTHYSDDDLTDYLFDRDLADDPGALEAHLGACAVCGEKLAQLRELETDLEAAETWQEVESFLGGPGRLDEIVGANQRMTEDERRAAAMLDPLLASPLTFRDADLQNDRRFHTSGVVRVLCSRAHHLHEERPQFSLVVATKAFNVALKLTDARERRFGAALSQRERANALRYLGRFPEALEALEKAEKLFTDSPGSDPFDVAVVWLIRATVFVECERLGDAFALARRSADIFHGYGDDDRELSAAMIEGGALLYSGAADEAAAAFERVVQIARRVRNEKMLASGLENAAISYIQAGDYETALDYNLQASSIFEQMGMSVEEARARWKFGSLLVARGELDEGIRCLEKSRNELLALGLTNDAALATLEWAEASLAIGQIEGVADACRGILLQFNSAGLLRNAKIAVAYLHEAFRTGTATPAVVRHVRTYLEQLPFHPSSFFSTLS
jgi:tetratricopeptide (TPR) repeat protein